MRTVVVVAVVDTTLAVKDFGKLGLSTQFAGSRLRALLGKVTSFPTPATRKPMLERLVVIVTMPPALPVSVPMSMRGEMGVAVGVAVSVDVAVLVGVGVSVWVEVDVAVGV